ncbi:hypothetical protein F5051DRAFT_423267, partial [Lentinula edodes]
TNRSITAVVMDNPYLIRYNRHILGVFISSIISFNFSKPVDPTQRSTSTMAGGTSPPLAQQRSRRRASRSPSVATDPGSRPPRNRRRGGGQQNQGGGGPIGGLPGVNKVADTVTGAVGSVGDAVGGLLGGVAGGGGGGDKPLKLRLDLNLDVAVEIKARVHGDLTISLLYAIAGLDSLAWSISSSKAIAMNVYL